jgi:phosphoribosyl 1,2-cyclic phosphodiesterase
MKLKVFGSSSKGNGYALTDTNGNTLLIECGVPFKEIQRYLDFDLSKIVGCIVSHVHGDHSKYIKEYLKFGIDVSMSFETIKALDLLKHHKAKGLLPNKKYDILSGEFKVMPIELKHDVPCFGYIIQHKEMGNTVFITDSYYSPLKYANISNWIVEANYSQEILDKKVSNNETHSFLRNRILTSHFSLENCIDMFKSNDMSKTNNIVLTHLSDSNSDAKLFKEKLTYVTEKTVHIAEPGLEINLDKTPF